MNGIIKKIVKKLLRPIRDYQNYKENCAFFSKEYALICYEMEKLRFSKLSEVEIKELQEKKDEYLLEFFTNMFSSIIKEHSNKHSSIDTWERIIWVFWLDGFENAPEIVKCCISSIKKHSECFKVILLDKNNYEQYTEIPDIIKNKHASGKIGNAHFSDIIRMDLLSRHGGIWMDATLFLTKPMPDYIFDQPFFTCKTYDPNSSFFSKSRWTGFLLGGVKDFPLFSFVKEMMISYWEKEDKAIDYLMMDYFFYLSYINNNEIRDTIDSLPNNNFDRNNLMNNINNIYNEETYKKITGNESFIQKLSWRYGNPVKFNKDGFITNYGYICKECLGDSEDEK